MINLLKKGTKMFEGSDGAVERGERTALFSEMLKIVIEVAGLKLVN